jgi:hypothetical protein
MLRITVSDSRRVYGRETRAQIRWLWIGRLAICAIAAPQQISRPAVTDEIVAKRIERGLGQLRRVVIDGYPGNPG